MIWFDVYELGTFKTTIQASSSEAAIRKVINNDDDYFKDDYRFSFRAEESLFNVF